MIKHAGFFHSSEEKQFSYEYLSGTHLLQTLTKPNNMSLTLSYETQRDLLTGMSYKRGNTGVASRTYTYDAAGRPITRKPPCPSPISPLHALSTMPWATRRSRSPGLPPTPPIELSKHLNESNYHNTHTKVNDEPYLIRIKKKLMVYHRSINIHMHRDMAKPPIASIYGKQIA